MKLALIGDVHGEFQALARIVATIPEDCQLIQVGDFGYWPGLKPVYDRVYAPLNRPIFFLDGNHDHSRLLCRLGSDWENAQYIPRGTFANGVLYVGGATSVDRAWRPHNHGPHAWFDEEVVTAQDVLHALTNVRECGAPVQLMVTHSPPDWLIRKHFSPYGLMQFGHDPAKWVDESAVHVEALWRELGEPPLVCGHMHRTVVDGNCHILDINEVLYLEVDA